MVYAKKIETAAYVPEIIVPNNYFLDKELYYKGKNGEYVRKNDLTNESMIGIHRIEERRWSAPDESTKVLAKRAVEKLSVTPDMLVVGHDDGVPVPAVSGIAQNVMGFKNAAFCDIISNEDLPGKEIAWALVDSGKYKHVVYASSPKISRMISEDKFDKDIFSRDICVYEKNIESNFVNPCDASCVDFVIVDHKDVFESKSDYVKAELDWAGVSTLDVICGCPGYVMAVEIADALIRTKKYETITCVGAETLEKMADPRHLDHTLYGSAAGAATYQASSKPGVVCSYFKGFGDFWHYLRLDDGVPLNDGTKTGPYLVMEGHQLYRFVRRELPSVLSELAKRLKSGVSGKDPNDPIVYLLHQMNGKLIEHSLCSYLDVKASIQDLQNGVIPEEVKEFIDNYVPMSVMKYGNSSSATIPVTEDHARRGIILKRFSQKAFDNLELGSGTKAINASAGAGFIFGGFGEIL